MLWTGWWSWHIIWGMCGGSVLICCGRRARPSVTAGVGQAVRSGLSGWRAAELACLTGYRIRFTQAEQAAAVASGRRAGFAHCHAMNGQSAHVDALGNFYVCSSFVGDPRFYIGNVQEGLDEKAGSESAQLPFAFQHAGMYRLSGFCCLRRRLFCPRLWRRGLL